jgi:hypothetical protein
MAKGGIVKESCSAAGRDKELKLAFRTSPRNARVRGGAAKAQGHGVIVTMAMATSVQGTWKGVGGEGAQVLESGDWERNNGGPGREAETFISMETTGLRVWYTMGVSFRDRPESRDSSMPRDVTRKERRIRQQWEGGDSLP